MSAYGWTELDEKWSHKWGSAVVLIEPRVFLTMTTLNKTNLKKIEAEAKTMDFYASFADDTPFLELEKTQDDEGFEAGHQGRHRAVALSRERPGALYRICVRLYPYRRGSSWTDVPRTWVAPRRQATFDVGEMIQEGALVVDEYGPFQEVTP